MKVTSIATVEGNPLQSGAGLWQITSPAGEPPLRFFRRVARLRFEIGRAADRIELVHGGTTLKAAFGSFDYDALSPDDDSLKAKIVTSDGAVIVTLDAPRLVTEIRLSPGKAGYRLHVYRLDGDTLANKPTVTAKINAKSVGASPSTREKAIGKVPGVSVATLPEEAAFTDRRFAIRIEESAKQSLDTSDLVGIKIRTHPTGPRLGLAAPGAADSALFFWQMTGEAIADQGNVELGEAFGEALERYFEDLSARLGELTDEEGHPAPPPEFVEVDVVAASDAPCVLDVTAFEVVYRLVVRALFSGEGEEVEKQVLRFPGGSVTIQEVSVILPGNAAVESATLEAAESFRDDRLLTSGSGDGSPTAELMQREGVHVGIERWAAQGVTPPHAISVSGMAFALMAVAANTRVLVKLQEDWRGRPSGRELAAGTIMLERVGQRSWVTLLFPEPIVIPSKPHWILMKAADGRAVWLADVGDTPARVFEEPDRLAMWVERGVLDGLQALYGFLSHGERAQEEQQAVSLAIGEHVVAAVGKENGTRTYDLSLAINNYLDGLPPNTTMVAAPLTLTAASQGFITLYPPIVKYDLR